MIFVFSREKGEQICIDADTKPAIVDMDRNKPKWSWETENYHHCWVSGCINAHEYGYNFCREHKWILPISAEKLLDGFQVGLIDYWKKKARKILTTHKYKRGD